MSAYGIPFSSDTIDLKPEDIKQIASIGERFCKKKNMGNADVTLTFAVSAKGEIAIVESFLQAGGSDFPLRRT
ncbi:MAG TPA: hypothetical protein VLG38_00880 [Gammaproteobacteria bacterium]|nr:hypothetical protein [Gammaproteobacteria bacterium]